MKHVGIHDRSGSTLVGSKSCLARAVSIAQLAVPCFTACRLFVSRRSYHSLKSPLCSCVSQQGTKLRRNSEIEASIAIFLNLYDEDFIYLGGAWLVCHIPTRETCRSAGAFSVLGIGAGCL